MRFRIGLLFLVVSSACLAQAGDALPQWVAAQVPDAFVLAKPGVHPLKDGKLLGVGYGKPNPGLRGNRAARLALESAEHDAKQRIARHLYPDEFAKYKTVSVEMRHAQRVFEQAAAAGGAYVAIVVDAGDVAIVPLPDASVILDARKVSVPPGILRYLEDPLLQLGGGRIFSHKDGWLALGVGVAPLFGADSLAERDALKRARLEAGRVLTETIFGSNFTVMEEESETQMERDGIVRMREWSSKRTRETIEGELRLAAEVGSWLTDDEHVAVVVAVANPPLDPGLVAERAPDDEAALIPEFPDWEVDEGWEYVLLSHPRLLRGGAILYPESGEIWAVGVGVGKLTGNPANDRINAPRAAEMDARRTIVKYLLGFSTKSSAESVEELTVVMAENGVESSSVFEALKKVTNEKASGFIRSLRKVGSWKAEDRKLLYQVHVVDATGLFRGK